MPANHPYPRTIHAALPGGPGLHVQPDPDPDRPEQPAGDRWWPHRLLEPAWLARCDFDLVHVHFGFDHRTPEQLEELASFLQGSDRPLVLTVHDLRSPHQGDPSVLDRQLDVLVPAARVVVTLTPWAARRIRERWGVSALVHPHPPLVPVEQSRRYRVERLRRAQVEPATPPVVAVACKSLRENCEPLRLLPALERAVGSGGARLRVLVHRGVVSAPATQRERRVRDGLWEAADRGVEVVAHDPMSDEELWRAVSEHEVAVLPYRFGTHSGWLEMCHDLGTFVAAPGFGGYADQGADAIYTADEDRVDEASLERAVTALIDRSRQGALAGDSARVQAERRHRAAAWHTALYAHLVGADRVPVLSGSR
ncbi:glycosyltransferase [Nocardioides mangrovicus]|uniref:glycosyltransferase n=1 Tax=Nocardioides mangrovicus TaxID=2478913 RepID=UPI0013140674|nr:glycosyltransferase [Nocardioides mangrovicus]